MTKQEQAKGKKNQKSTLVEDYQYSGDMAERMRRHEKLKKNGVIDVKDYPMKRQMFPRTFF